MAYIEELFSDHFIQYASYVIRDRAIPSLDDGLKPVQRRILQSLWDMDDGKFHKVANIVGHCMQYHPHGETSIFGALVNLANKELFIEKQGNFGNIYTGDPASAARYIECRLSPLARRSLFNPDVTQFLPSYDGRRNEPIAFPAKLPFLLILGAEGIAVGMSTRILPHNFGEVICAMRAELSGEDFELLPDFPTGGLLDTSQYNKGNGKVLSRARLECGNGQITIRELPYGVTTESLNNSLEAAVKKNRIRLQNIQNFTAEEVEIVLQLPRDVTAEEQLEALYAFTDCEVSISCNLLTIDDKHPLELDNNSVLQHSCLQLKNILQAELELEGTEFKQQIFNRNLERIFIEDRLYKRIEELTKLTEIEESIYEGLEPYCQEGGELGRPVSKDELAALLRIPIRRISLYDIQRMQKEIRDLEQGMKRVEKHLKALTEYALSYLAQLEEEFGPSYPRRAELSSFAKVDIRQAARRDEMLRYDKKEGFLGYGLKSGIELFACSPFDRILLLRSSGCYSVFDVPEKLFIGKDIAFCHLADKEELAKLDSAVFYQDEANGQAFAKRLRFAGYILGKEYRLIPENARLIDFVAISSERSEQLRSLRSLLLKTDRGSKEAAAIKEQLQQLQKLPNLLAKPAPAIAAFAVLFQAEIPEPKKKIQGKKAAQNIGQEAQLWHYRFADLPEKTAKAKGQLLRKQKVASVKQVSLKKLNDLLLSNPTSPVLAPDFPPPPPKRLPKMTSEKQENVQGEKQHAPSTKHPANPQNSERSKTEQQPNIEKTGDELF